MSAVKLPEFSLKSALSPFVMVGGAIIFLFFFCFGSWMSYAPLASAAVASGSVSPDSSRKAVQHLEGGIIREILVKDGDYVRRGMPLMRLDDTLAKSQFQSMQVQLIRLKAIRARLVALQAGAEKLEFDKITLDAAELDSDLKAFLKAQNDLFVTRRDANTGRRQIYERQIEQVGEQMNGLRAEAVGNQQQLNYIEDELGGLQWLLENGNALKSRVLQLQRAQSEVTGKLASNRSSLAGAEQKIGEIKLTIVNAEIEFRDKLADEHMRINSEIAQLEEKLAGGRDILERTVLPSPVDGTIVGLRFKTSGGVVRPGEVILNIVPSKDELVIDARVQPIDARSVTIGLLAQVNLLPYASRNMPIIEGRVIGMSADALTDERTNEKYYEAKVLIDRIALAKIAPDVELTPGMPADVLIVTGQRSALRYILEPIERSFRMSFRQL